MPVVFQPSKDGVPWNGGTDVERQDVHFTATDGVKLNGWFFPRGVQFCEKTNRRFVCHGNGGNITYLEALYTQLAEAGVNVLLFDYRGYGKSEGQPGEEGTYRDAQAAYQWLRQSGFAATNIFVYGESLGGAIAAELVLREPVGGLILEGSPTSIADIGATRFPWLPARLLNHIKYNTQAKLPRVKVPVLIMPQPGRPGGSLPDGEAKFCGSEPGRRFFGISRAGTWRREITSQGLGEIFLHHGIDAIARALGGEVLSFIRGYEPAGFSIRARNGRWRGKIKGGKVGPEDC